MIDFLTYLEGAIPTLILLGGVALLSVIGWHAQRNPSGSVNFADLFTSPTGRLTWDRIVAMGTFIVSTWVVASYASQKILSNDMFMYFMLFGSGSAVAVEALRIWSGRPTPQILREAAVPSGMVVTTNVNPPISEVPYSADERPGVKVKPPETPPAVVTTVTTTAKQPDSGGTLK